MLRPNAWEREMIRVLDLAEKTGVRLRLSDLVTYDVHDLQRLQWALATSQDTPSWWQRLLGRGTWHMTWPAERSRLRGV
jgi:hypothetical protein